MRQAFRPMHARRWDEMISTRHSGTWDEIPNALCRKAFGPLGVTHRETFRPYFVPSARMHGTKLRKLGRNRSGPESRFAESGTKSLLTKPSNYWANRASEDGRPGTDSSRREKRSRNWLRPAGSWSVSDPGSAERIESQPEVLFFPWWGPTGLSLGRACHAGRCQSCQAAQGFESFPLSKTPALSVPDRILEPSPLAPPS